MGDDAADIGDRARDLVPAHHLDRALDQEELRFDVEREQPVPDLLGGALERAAIGRRGAVHQDVEPAEALLGAVDEVAAVGQAREVGMDVLGRAAGAADLARDPLAALDVAAAERDARRRRARRTGVPSPRPGPASRR